MSKNAVQIVQSNAVGKRRKDTLATLFTLAF